jgi:hypothetical protein
MDKAFKIAAVHPDGTRKTWICNERRKEQVVTALQIIGATYEVVEVPPPDPQFINEIRERQKLDHEKWGIG